MAHLKQIRPYQCQVCERKATVELINDRSSSNGFFCLRHGEMALKDLIDSRSHADV